jgi:ubiquinone/menaquinone biosynthesis C-methylase UbiE
MLALARRNVLQAGFAERVRPVLQDAKTLAWADGDFHAVISNSIVHHLADPRPALVEMTRVLQPGGVLFVRDLMRPETPEAVEELVALYAGEESPRQQQLFRQSLHAALTLDEIRSLADNLPLADCHVEATSDRHWTLSAVR